MIRKEFSYKKWFVNYTPGDGARLNELSYEGLGLVTTEPEDFKPPQYDYGTYETRPVYGYDDCFPSVESCDYPGKKWKVPDHGELCWLPWQVMELPGRLAFSVNSAALPITFKREMIFEDDALIWEFEVLNNGEEELPFQHAIHPMIPLDKVENFSLPEFESVYDAINDKTLDLNKPNEVKQYLLSKEKGTANMLFLRNVNSSELSMTFNGGLSVKMEYPHELFNSIGIWWNNTGYPDEDGCRRNECAFEPISGLTSDLSKEYSRGQCLSVKPGQRFNWRIKWLIG